MKKTLIALLALAGVAAAAEPTWSYDDPTIQAGSYTLKMDNWTTGDSTLYDYLYGVFVEGGTLTFNLNINYTGSNCGYYQALLHVGKKDTGFSIYANGGPNLIVSEKHNTGVGYEFSTDMGTGDHVVTITLQGDATTRKADVSVVVDSGTELTKVDSLDWAKMEWDTASGEAAKYSINNVAPGWENYNDNNKAANSTTLQSGSVAYTVGTGKAYLVPEPATATLSLLALAGLAARRRRK